MSKRLDVIDNYELTLEDHTRKRGMGKRQQLREDQQGSSSPKQTLGHDLALYLSFCGSVSSEKGKRKREKEGERKRKRKRKRESVSDGNEMKGNSPNEKKK